MTTCIFRAVNDLTCTRTRALGIDVHIVRTKYIRLLADSNSLYLSYCLYVDLLIQE